MKFSECLLPLGLESFVFPLISENINIKTYIIIILLVDFYGWDTWSLILWE